MMDELLFYLYLWFFLRPWAYLTLLIGVSKVLKFYSGLLSCFPAFPDTIFVLTAIHF